MAIKKEYVTPKLPTGLHIKWQGIFQLEALYKKMKFWLDFKGYTEFEEEEYLEVIKGDSKEIHIRWRAEKPKSSYFSYLLEFQFLITGFKTIEVPIEGKNVKMNKGTFELRMAACVVKDCGNRWKNKFIQDTYEKYIIRKMIDERKIDIYGDAYELHDEIKRFLTLRRF